MFKIYGYDSYSLIHSFTSGLKLIFTLNFRCNKKKKLDSNLTIASISGNGCMFGNSSTYFANVYLKFQYLFLFSPRILSV